MLQFTLLLMSALAKIYTAASILHLPLETAREVIRSSEPALILALFCFVAGETMAYIPAMVVTALYIAVEIVPRKLRFQDSYFKYDKKP